MLNKKLIIIIIIIVITIIVFGIYFIINKKNNKEFNNIIVNKQGSSVQLPTDSKDLNKNKLEQKKIIPKIINEEDIDKNDIENTARFFIEMLGSYSSSAKFKNVIDLQPMMTSRMKQWSEDFIQRNLSNVGKYNEKVTTKVLKTKILNYQQINASVLIYSRREENNNDGNKVYNQEVKVNLVKNGGEWLIDGIDWQ